MSGAAASPFRAGFVATFVATLWPVCGHRHSNEPFTCDSSALGTR